MKKNKVSINIISSFNHPNFVSLLKNSDNFDWKVIEADYNQVFQTLTDPKAKMWKKKNKYNNDLDNSRVNFIRISKAAK